MFRFPSRCPAFLPFLAFFFTGTTPQSATAQKAEIVEEVRVLESYPFSEPNPVPLLTRDRRLYPYYSFEGYSATSTPREWKVVRLENEYIQVFVLPEVGGKVWGAVVKKTGHEFIYRNEVLKFRNIALRGPWTSGGIEMNFGVIGHTPATATPVDYLLRENPDGSVSCIVGSMDLPSRTHWRVEIRLPADKAFFETRVLWYNPTPLEQPYYNWMTAAAFAKNDLEMTMPGNAYLQHSGQVEDWPVDQAGRYLPLYRNNTFGGSKSYHVVGELHDFFGGYYQEEGYGFGHWARYEDMPGQKLWLWALSREGGIWEDLLTDTDGQYVEFQAGRLFVQYSPGTPVNPITEARFDPLSSTAWSESWFPVEGIGGLTEASRDGAMHVAMEDGWLSVAVNAFGAVTDTLRIWSGEELVHSEPVTLAVLEPFVTRVELPPDKPYRVEFPVMALAYDSDPASRRLARPFETDPEARLQIPPADLKAFQARELMKGRRYPEARALFRKVLEEEPWHREALLELAELSFRSADPEEGLGLVNRALQLDAYDPQANFLAGILYRSMGRTADARDAFGWAARATGYRAGAYTQLAEIMIGLGAGDEAQRYARLALDYDRYNVTGLRSLAVVGRRSGNPALMEEALSELEALDPLSHLVPAERYLATLTPASADALLSALGGEFPRQSLLELAVGYANLGLKGDARTLLGLGRSQGMGGNPVQEAWLAWLDGDPFGLPDAPDPAFAFPYRPETLPVLRWAAEKNSSWVWKYLLGLNLWALDRDAEAATTFETLGQTPDFGPFYTTRGHLLAEVRGTDPEADFRKAVALDPGNRILHIHLIRHLQDVGAWEGALNAVGAAMTHFPGDFNLELLQAKALINLGRGPEAAEILARTQVLPSEGARESHRLWEEAHSLWALDALEAGDFSTARVHALKAMEWPESLGQGRPYAPEERLARFLLGRAEEGLGNAEAADGAFQAVVDATREIRGSLGPLDLLAVEALNALGLEEEIQEMNRWRGVSVGALREGLQGTLEGRLILRAISLRN